jgi:hypothetical protein
MTCTIVFKGIKLQDSNLGSDGKSVGKLEFLVLFNGKGLDIGKIVVKKGGNTCDTLYLSATLKLILFCPPIAYAPLCVRIYLVFYRKPFFKPLTMTTKILCAVLPGHV